MSRKDYVAIAAAIRAEADRGVTPVVLRPLALRIAEVFAADNPHFDRERFLVAALGDAE